jgi:hypothetical protein
VQSTAKRTLADGREVSAFWGGSKNPNGSKKRSKLVPEEAAAKQKVNNQQRAARKADMRRRFQEHRAVLEGRNQWQGTRKYDEWLMEIAGRALGDREEAEAAVMPMVLLLCDGLLTHVCTEMARIPSDRRDCGPRLC